MSPAKYRKSETLLQILKKRGEKGLSFAKKSMLTERIKCGNIHDALEYYTTNWENFTHPAFFSIACESVDSDPDKSVEVQAAIAMLAAALDLHDDIIDRSYMKHGKPTVFGKFGQDIALLLGNAFFVGGFTLLGKSITRLPKEKIREIFETLKKSMFEVGCAHALELILKGRTKISPKEYMQILKMKAASVEADIRIGAIVGEGTHSEVENLTRYGRILGMLATLREEFIDVFELQEMRQRLQRECLPMPVLYALQTENAEEIQEILFKKRITTKDIDDLLDIVFETTKVKNLKRKMRALIQDALRSTSELTNQKMKLLLDELAVSSLEDL